MLWQASKFVAMPVGCPVGSRSWLRDSPVGRQRFPVLLRCSKANPNVRAFTKHMFDSEKVIQRSRLLTHCSPVEPSSNVHPNQDISDAVREATKNVRHSTGLTASCEDALNKHINLLYYISYIYDYLFVYFARDNVALLGFAEYFKDESDNRRKCGEELMKYMNKVGGKVKLENVSLPEIVEFDNVTKYMEVSYWLEHNAIEVSYATVEVAHRDKDKTLSQFMDGQFIPEQMKVVERISKHITRLRMIGEDGNGIFNFDRILRKG